MDWNYATPTNETIFKLTVPLLTLCVFKSVFKSTATLLDLQRQQAKAIANAGRATPALKVAVSERRNGLRIVCVCVCRTCVTHGLWNTLAFVAESWSIVHCSPSRLSHIVCGIRPPSWLSQCGLCSPSWLGHGMPRIEPRRRKVVFVFGLSGNIRATGRPYTKPAVDLAYLQ